MNRLLIIIFLLLPFAVLGNNVRIVGTVKTPANGMSGNTVSIQFTLEWENSWRDAYNHDAVYIALRYKYLKQNPVVWYPVYLQNEGHIADNGFECVLAPGHLAGNNVGVFIKPSTVRNGIARTNITLKWDLSTTASNGAGRLVSSNLVMGEVILACTGIEMVYIPRGAFALGDHANLSGSTDASPRSFRHHDQFIPETADLVSTRYEITTNPNGPASNPASLAANHTNDLTNSTSNAWVSGAWAGADDSKHWTIDFGKLADGTELPLSSATRPAIKYISIESIPGRVPKTWYLYGAQKDQMGGWVELLKGTSADWGTSLERTYPPQKAIPLTSTGDYSLYRVIIKSADMPGGATPVIKSISMTTHDLPRSNDYTFIVDSTVIPLGGVRGLSADNDTETWSSGTLGAAYPTGYNGFYAMKYEISQDQYCGFLQMLSPGDQRARTIGVGLNALAPEDYIFGPSRLTASNRNSIVVSKRSATGDTVSFACNLDPSTPMSLDGDGMPLACNYLTTRDLLSYASWIGLRPLTELEYERLCRPPYPYTPRARECAWNGSATILPGDLRESGKSNETVSSGNANYGNRLPGPVRVGIFAQPSGTQKTSGSGYWGVQDLSGNLSELYYNANAPGRKYNANLHGNGTLIFPSGWDTLPSAFGVRGGSFRSSPFDIASSNRQNASLYITSGNKRDSTVSFRLGRSCPEGPRLSSILTLPDGRNTESGGQSDTLCDGIDYVLSGNEPAGHFTVSYLWYKSENNGRSWELRKGETGRDLSLKNLRNTGMADNQYREYWFRRKAIRDNSDGMSPIVKLLVLNPSYTVSRLRDTLDGYGEATGIRVTTKYPTTFTWRYLASGAPLASKQESDRVSYYLPRRTDLATADTTKQMHGSKMLLVTMNIGNACERSEVIGVDVINTLDKDLMKVKNYGSYRAWGDGTYAPSAEAYRRPSGGYEYRGDIGSGIYRIDPDGRDGSIEPFDVYCDMVTEGGGWMLVMSGASQSSKFNYSSAYWTNSALLNEREFDPKMKIDRKNAVFIHCPVKQTLVEMGIDANGKTMVFKENISRNNCISLFSTTTYLNKQNINTVISTYGLNTLLGCAWQKGNAKSGFAIPGGGGTRYGIIANQTSETGTGSAETHDSAVGIGLTTYGGGAYAGHGDVAVCTTNRSGYFWFWIK